MIKIEITHRRGNPTIQTHISFYWWNAAHLPLKYARVIVLVCLLAAALITTYRLHAYEDWIFRMFSQYWNSAHRIFSRVYQAVCEPYRSIADNFYGNRTSLHFTIQSLLPALIETTYKIILVEVKSERWIFGRYKSTALFVFTMVLASQILWMQQSNMLQTVLCLIASKWLSEHFARSEWNVELFILSNK